MTNARDTAQARAIDAWIASDLAARFESTLGEPLPQEFLALLAE